MSLRFADFALDQERRLLLRSDLPVPLEPKAYELLNLLLSRRPRALSKAQIRNVLWPGTFVSESALAGLVADLRAALGDAPRRPRFIRTVHGFGYAFCGEVAGTGPARPEGVSGCRLLWESQEIALAEGDNFIGRGEGCVVRSRAVRVSRRHARIRVEGQPQWDVRERPAHRGCGGAARWRRDCRRSRGDGVPRPRRRGFDGSGQRLTPGGHYSTGLSPRGPVGQALVHTLDA